MNVTTRADLRTVEHLLQRALVYSRQFDNWNRDRWPHLKNEEDFDRIWGLPEEQRLMFEKVYSEGRDMAHDLCMKLCAFDEVELHPTFKSFVDALEEYLRKWPSDLVAAIEGAEEMLPSLPFRNWAVEQMIDLSRRQLTVVEALQIWVTEAKRAPLYRRESGEVVPHEYHGVAIHMGDNYTNNVTGSTVGGVASGPGSTVHGSVQPSEKGFWSGQFGNLIVGTVVTVVGGLILYWLVGG